MPYIAEVSRKNPSCFIFLIDRSGSMSEAIGGGAGKRKADGVADAINRLLQNLCIKCSKGEEIRNYYEVGVIGYGSVVGPAFSGSLQGRSLVTISEIANAPARIEDRVKKVDDGAGGLAEQRVKFQVWFDPMADGGTPMAEALSQAHALLAEWTKQHQSSYPPIVINISDGEANTPVSVEAAALTRLSTTDGNVLLLNCHISAYDGAPILFPDSVAGLPDDFARMLFEISSPLPDNLKAAARSEGFNVGENAKGFAFNAELAGLIRFLDIGTRPGNLR